jgi:hypothetical protein
VHNGPFSFVADFLSMAMENPKFEIRKSVDLTSDFEFRIYQGDSIIDTI